MQALEYFLLTNAVIFSIIIVYNFLCGGAMDKILLSESKTNSRSAMVDEQAQSKVSNEIFTGLWAALPTPLDRMGRVNPYMLSKLVKHLSQSGIEGVYVCGTTGEGYHLSEFERCEILETTVESGQNLKIIAHIGAANPQESRRLMRHAEQCEVHAISSMIPFIGGYCGKEIKNYYQVLASETNLPLVIYFMPAMTGTSNGGYDFLHELLSIKGIGAIKYTDFDLRVMRELVLSGKKVLFGRDEMLVSSLIMGACGAIGSTYSLFAKEAASIQTCLTQGHLNRAIEQQDKINTFLRTALRMPYLSAIKQVLTWQGIDMGACRFPREHISDHQALQLQETCKQIGLI